MTERKIDLESFLVRTIDYFDYEGMHYSLYLEYDFTIGYEVGGYARSLHSALLF